MAAVVCLADIELQKALFWQYVNSLFQGASLLLFEPFKLFDIFFLIALNYESCNHTVCV